MAAVNTTSRARATEVYESVLTKWPDIGILFFCVLSLIFRLNAFHARRRANEQALRACCVAEEDLQQTCELGHHGLTVSFAQAQQLERHTVVNAECYVQFARTMDFLDADTAAASVRTDEPLGAPAPSTSRAETRAFLEHALASGAAGKKDGGGDPVLILLQLPLERRLATMVNWLSVVSNSLTYYLRPSQVLYSFVFNMADFFLFVVSVAEERHRAALLTELMRTTDALMTSSAAATVPLTSAMPVAPTIVPPGATRRTLRGARPADPPVRLRWNRRATAACVRPWRCLIGGLVASLTTAVDALQLCWVFVAASCTSSTDEADGSSPAREAVGREDRDEDGLAAGLPDSLGRRPTPLSPAETVDAALSGPGQTGVQELLLLNGAFAFALVLFHVNHLLFDVGAVAGYTAGAMNLFLLGCAITTVGVQCRNWCCTGRRRSEARAKENTPRCPWSVLLSHWSAAACAVFYFFMLLDEGTVLWATHVNFIRWYAATTALGITEVLQSFCA